jgi:hypothetical protein
MPGKYLRRISVRFTKTFKASWWISAGTRYFISMEVFQMDYASLKSLTGFSLNQIEVELDRELPADAYSAVPGGANLTDIDPGYMRDELNRLFGICGIGWGYHYDVADVEYEIVKRGQGTTNSAILKKLVVWFKLVDGDGGENRLEVPSSGGSLNDNAGYALSGAITNAIGKAVSNIGFQKSVYLGLRSHKTVGKSGPKPAKPSAPAKPAAKSAAKPAKPAPKPAAQDPVEDEIIDDEPAVPVSPDAASLETFVIGVGKRKGQTLGDQPLDVISYYANMAAVGNEQIALKNAAQQLLKVRANGNAVPA